MKDNWVELTVTFGISIVIWWIVALCTKFFFDYKANQLSKKNIDTSEYVYINLSNQKKWSYIQCYLATLMAILTVIFCALAALECSPPEHLSRPDVFLGNTFFRNLYCREHTNYE